MPVGGQGAEGAVDAGICICSEIVPTDHVKTLSYDRVNNMSTHIEATCVYSETSHQP